MPVADGVKGSEVALCGVGPGPIFTVSGLNGLTRLLDVQDAFVGGELNGP